MTARQLTSQNATITTATVEIKALTVGGKQVTQSVFRQLDEEPLIEKDGTLRGFPWGRVNYHPDKCEGEPDHMHIVWQQGTDLFRCKASLRPWGLLEHPLAMSVVQGLFCASAHSALPDGFNRVLNPALRGFPYVYTFTQDGVLVATTSTELRGNRWDNDFRHACATDEDRARVLREFQDDVGLEAETRRSYQLRWHSLALLPHLFIAV